MTIQLQRGKQSKKKVHYLNISK